VALISQLCLAALKRDNTKAGDNYIVVETQYDVLGHAYKTSNPYRLWHSESAVWTTQLFDALGRVISVTTPDNAVVTTSYSGNELTVTDQAGKVRKSVTDALGRLTRVYENPNGFPITGFLTTYEYDVSDSLTKVIQDNSQQPPRVFVYDSLKRLTSANNPESGTINYQYDSNGNLTFRPMLASSDRKPLRCAQSCHYGSLSDQRPAGSKHGGR
jgi:YD repeat-containing protein